MTALLFLKLAVAYLAISSAVLYVCRGAFTEQHRQHEAEKRAQRAARSYSTREW